MHAFARGGLGYIRRTSTVPTLAHISELRKPRGVSIRVILLNILAQALLTVGVVASLYAGYLYPDYRVTASQLSAVVNGFATILLFVLIDPQLSVMTDDVVAGATSETGSGFVPHTTAAGIREVLGEALRVAPGLAAAELREIRVGLRPYSDDTLPVLGGVPGVRGVYLNTGHGPSGLTLGLLSGKLVAEEMLGKRPATDLAEFSVARFGGRAG